MSDPFSTSFGRPEPFGLRRVTKTPYELIEYQDRVARAAALIRDQELALWFEPDWSVALEIALRCPECSVCSVPPDAVLLDNLSEPPPWRRRISAPS